MKPNCIATRGGHCLIDDGEGMGHVEYLDGSLVGGAAHQLPIQSILARGYWEEVPGRMPSQLPTGYSGLPQK